jgi:predicted ester cyclase
MAIRRRTCPFWLRATDKQRRRASNDPTGCMHLRVEDTIAEGDKLCVRWECTCRHTGDGLGVAPTGKTVHTTGISIMRLAGTMFVEAWQNWDMLGLMEQIRDDGKSGTYIDAS